jgi:tRNA 2-thiouridine synthesizing protein A
VQELIDARGLRCPLPLIRARQALASLPGDALLVVLATDPEAPIDLAALASDTGRAFSSAVEDGVWRLELAPE